MTEQRFFILKDEEFDDVFPCIRDRNSKIDDIYGHYKYDNLEEICNELNRLEEENEQLKTQLQNTSDQRDEFHRGARENANRVGKLKKENEQLKERNKKRLQRLKNQRKSLEKQQRAIWGYKGDIKQLKQENEQLKSNVIDLIDKKINKLKNTNEVSLIPRESVEILKELKKELQE